MTAEVFQIANTVLTVLVLALLGFQREVLKGLRADMKTEMLEMELRLVDKISKAVGPLNDRVVEVSTQMAGLMREHDHNHGSGK